MEGGLACNSNNPNKTGPVYVTAKFSLRWNVNCSKNIGVGVQALDCHLTSYIDHVIWLYIHNDLMTLNDLRCFIPPLISKLLSSLLYGGIYRSLKRHRISSDSVCLHSVSADLWQGRYSDAGLIKQALQRPSFFSLISLRLWVSVKTKKNSFIGLWQYFTDFTIISRTGVWMADTNEVMSSRNEVFS